MHCDVNAYCLLMSETNEFKCQCKPGFNGTGKVCTGELYIKLVIRCDDQWLPNSLECRVNRSQVRIVKRAKDCVANASNG